MFENLKKIFFQNRFKLYMVGGAVRDTLMGRTPHDYDFATDATPEEMICMAEENGVEVIPTGIKYGTITFKIDETLVEVTTFRADGNYSDGRRPDEVSFSKDLLDDLKRRDFTINAIALNILTNEYIDPFNGIQDIKDRIIRAVGDPVERFTEDGLRILRAIRFMFKLHFRMDDKTYLAIQSNWHLLKHISQERITAEFLQILDYGFLGDTRDCYLMDGLIKSILPNNYIDDETFCNWFFYTSLFESFTDIEGKLAFLLKNVGTNVLETCYRLKLSKQMSRNVVASIMCKELLESLYSTEETVYIVRKMVSKYGMNNAIRGICLYGEVYDLQKDDLDNLLSMAKDADLEATTLADLRICGDDLIFLGCRGVEVGAVLDYCLDRVLRDQSLNTREELVKMVKDFKKHTENHPACDFKKEIRE